jgi:aminoglycoside 2''-phosphotransferase
MPSGWDNIVVDVNDRWIFRFPRSKFSERNRQREVKLLELLREQLTIPIPTYSYVARPGGGDKYGFAGYKKIPGTPVTVRGYQTAWTRKLSRGLAKLLRELHSIKTTKNLAKIVSSEWTTQRMRKHHGQLRTLAYRYLDRETRGILESFFRKSMNLLEQSIYERTLIHSDLTDRNILVHPKDGRLAGVLDWGDARISDPALDFCGLFEVNRRLGYETVRSYSDRSEGFLERVELYWRMLPYFEILYGIYSNHPRIRDSGLKRIRTRLEAPGLVEQ